MENLSNIDLIGFCAESIENHKAWLEFIRRFNRHIKLSVIKAYRLLSISNLGKEIILNEEIRDLVQEVYIKLVKNNCKLLKNLKPGDNGSISAYLSLTCVSVVKDHFRKIGRLKRKPPVKCIDNGAYITNEGKLINKKMFLFIPSNSEDQLIAKDLLEKVKNYYSSVHPKRNNKKRKLIFQLYFLKGLSIKDISRIKGLNISLANANALIWRMKKEIRDFVCNDLYLTKAK